MKKIIFVCFFGGVAMIMKLAIWIRSPYLSRDSIFYVGQINVWYTTGEIVAEEGIYQGLYHPPFFQFLVKNIMIFGVSALHAGLLLNMIFGSFVAILMYYIGCELSHNRLVGFACMAIALLHPSINHLSVEIQRDIGYLFFSCLLFLSIIHIMRLPSTKKWCIVGFLLSCAILFRIESIEFFPITCFMLFFSALRNKESIMRTLIKSFVFLLSFSLSFLLLCYLMELRSSDVKTVYMSYYTLIAKTL